MNAVGIFFIVLVVLLIAAAAGWIIFTQLRARRLGLPAPTISSYNPFARSDPSPYGPPSPAPGGIRGWINKIRGGNNRSAAGAYEQPLAGGGRSHRALDPDEAWDTRVGNEADAYGPSGYYEEQELGHHDPYSGSEYPMNLAATPGVAPSGFGGAHHGHHEEDERRGRSRDRDIQPSAPGRGGGGSLNPFDDDAAEPSNISLRGVSPRPVIDTAAASRGVESSSESPTERRSVFRENV